MAVQGHGKQFALDANLLFDLAAEKDFAHTFREVFQERGYQFRVPPTVIQEIAYAALHKSGEEQHLAFKSLQSMRSWGLVPYDLKSVGHGISEQFSRKLMGKGLLPTTEFNDGVILAETSLASIPVLVTSDEHLLGIDRDLLLGCFADSDLPTVEIVHPKPLLKAVR
ncbi:MAG: type II toxin-antitoxin system VapC family toxin [Limisphaerales bacterium]